MTVNLFDQGHLGKKYLLKHKELTGSYYLTGDPRGQPLIILHGLTGNHIGMLPIAAHLSRYRCILPNLPGHGNNPLPPETTQLVDLAEWFLALVRMWPGAIVIAHSYGGSLSMMALSSDPAAASKCVLLNPVAATSRVAQGYRYLVDFLPLGISMRLNGVDLIRHKRREYLLERHTTSVADRFEQLDVAESHLVSSREHIAYFKALGRYFDNPDIFGHVPSELAKKTYCVVGSRDPIASDSNNLVLQKCFGKGHVRVCKQSGHLMPIEAADDTARIINKIL